MIFEEWAELSGYSPNNFRELLEAGNKGNKSNPWIAASLAYRAGIEEGKRQAAERITKILTSA